MTDKILPLASIIAFGGAVSLAFGYAAHRREVAMKGWPTVQGMVVSSKIVQTLDARLRTPAYSRLAPSKPSYNISDVWAVDVEYKYTVNGTEYGGYRATSSRVVQKIDKKDGSQPGAELCALQSRFHAGSAAQVHYDPANPGESYLDYRESPENGSLFKTGFGLLLAGALIFIAGKLAFR